jgi:hypothetical protein
MAQVLTRSLLSNVFEKPYTGEWSNKQVPTFPVQNGFHNLTPTQHHQPVGGSRSKDDSRSWE